ncbi:MAG: hypothetical protein O3A84_08530 [Proteobacteria bacterium]|nr:hypothetical protein [Pseudomonadota bacterium]
MSVGQNRAAFDQGKLVDAVDILPLSIIPLESRALSRASMIKNTRLEGVLELFGGPETGSGQIYVTDIPKSFPDTSATDLGILSKLSKIPSYDVYSLRTQLKKQGIAVQDLEHLQLSDGMQKALDSYMRRFSRRLIQEIYGADSAMRDFDDIVSLVRSPNVKSTMENLRRMAEKLEISLDEVPVFMEEYGDTCLSVCYFRYCHDLIAPRLMDFLGAVDEILDTAQFQHDQVVVNNCTQTRAKISKMSSLVHGRLQIFDRRAELVWRNMTAERFREFRSLVENQHAGIGEMICILTVKLNAWAQKFPTESSGGLYKRAEYITTEMQAAL